MSNTLKGDPRPKSITPKALEKRVRRKLAHISAVLHINRPGTASYRVYGPINVSIPSTGEALFAGMTLSQIADSLGVSGAKAGGVE